MKQTIIFFYCFLNSHFLFAAEKPTLSEESTAEEVEAFLQEEGGVFQRVFLFYFDISTEGVFNCYSADLRQVADVKTILESIEAKLGSNPDWLRVYERKYNIQSTLYSHELMNLKLLTNSVAKNLTGVVEYADPDSDSEPHPRRLLLEAKVTFSFKKIGEEFPRRFKQSVEKWEEEFLDFFRKNSELLNEIAEKKIHINKREIYEFLRRASDMQDKYFKVCREMFSVSGRVPVPDPKSFSSVFFSIKNSKVKK